MRAIQYAADLQTGDAVSDIVRNFQRLFAKWGYQSLIGAAGWGDDVKELARPYQECSGDATHVYHFSVACSPLTAHFRAQPGRRFMVYHNITPPQWFVGYDEAALWSTGLARHELALLREDVTTALSYSEYNIEELRRVGFPQVAKIPFIMDFGRFKATADAATTAALNDGNTHMLFVGRVAPNKCFEDVVRTFYHYHRHINSASRLHLIGPLSIPPYVEKLRALIDGLGLADSVRLLGRVSDNVLAAFYKKAQVFLCMSEHEGFCVPIVEAMHYDVPVLAYAAGAVPDTMGSAGILAREKRFDVLAEMAHLMVTDEALRKRIIDGQRAHLARFNESAAEQGLREVLDVAPSAAVHAKQAGA